MVRLAWRAGVEDDSVDTEHGASTAPQAAQELAAALQRISELENQNAELEAAPITMGLIEATEGLAAAFKDLSREDIVIALKGINNAIYKAWKQQHPDEEPEWPEEPEPKPEPPKPAKKPRKGKRKAEVEASPGYEGEGDE